MDDVAGDDAGEPPIRRALSPQFFLIPVVTTTPSYAMRDDASDYL